MNHKCFRNHLKSDHNYTEEAANTAYEKAKLEVIKTVVLGEHVGEIIPILLDIETTGLIVRNSYPRIVELALKVKY